ncbi:F-box only protein 15-like isoform X2 [Pomacea canaliculata]|uniref:F-box only protein 15-like isoform X2 n=1 Tax=Pomacea canaliculata TaxID=400727 RepID=UPI000D73C51C|nr:F-box only protein 15-like isoform X2 [Pomacea canaliculata]
MDSERHKQQLRNYLDKHRNTAHSLSLQHGRQTHLKGTFLKGNTTSKREALVKEAAVLNNSSSSLSSASKSKATTKKTSTIPFRLYYRSRATFEDLPQETVLKIFTYLDVQSLMNASCVNKQWSAVASDNLLWQDIYKRYISHSEHNSKPAVQSESPQKLSASYWKNICMTRCCERRNKITFGKLKKLNPYTGLPSQTEAAVRQGRIMYKLCLVDKMNAEHISEASDMYWHQMATCVCWCRLDFLPVQKVHCIRLLASSPLIFGADGSPYHCSLVWEENLHLSRYIKENQVWASDDLINLYWLPGNLLLGTWKADSEIAFLMVGLHYDKLLHRSLLGTALACYKGKKHKPVPDDVDPTYGLHGYQVTLELHNTQQSLWSQQFRNLHGHLEDGVIDRVIFTLVRHDCTTDHTPLYGKIALPWRTELFKGRVKMVAWLDLTVLDERGDVFDVFSSPVCVQKSSIKGPDFEYGEDHQLTIRHSSDRTTMNMQLGQLHDGRMFVRHLELSLALSAVNDWFGTKY